MFEGLGMDPNPSSFLPLIFVLHNSTSLSSTREVFLPGPRPEGRTTGEPRTHTQSVDNKEQRIIICDKRETKQGGKERKTHSPPPILMPFSIG